MLVANLMSYELWWKVPRWLHRNDLLASKLQNSLLRVCLRFRMHKFVFSVDIVKMFRQI